MSSTRRDRDDLELHIVMLPWSAFGHMIPFFQLSLHLAKSGIQISFISTPNNLKRLPQIPSNLSSLLKFVEFQLPEVEQLPKGAESTVDLPYEKIPHLKTAYDLLQHPFKDFLQKNPFNIPHLKTAYKKKHPFKDFLANNRIDWIIHDGLPFWTAQIASIFSIPCVLFSVFSASSIVFFGPLDSLSVEGQRIVRPSPESLTSPPDWIDFPSKVAFRSHEAKGFFAGFYGENASGIRDADRLSSAAGGCEVVAVRSCYEYEREYLELLEKIYRKPVIPVGIFPSKASLLPETGYSRELSDWGWIFEWLDKQKAKTVVYVSFGSEVKLSREQVHEVAYGLELSGMPFLWAFKKPMWVVGDGDDGLPADFKRRIDGRGVVTTGWAPQLEILAHCSIGGSMFHGGWGSILETLQWGHPFVVLPLVIDHGLNARILVEKGLAVEVEMDEENGCFDRKDVERALRKAMVVDEEQENVLRVKAREMATVFGDLNLHQEYINGFVDYLKNKSKDYKYMK